MESIAAYPRRPLLLTLLPGIVVKLVIPALLLAYAGFYFTTSDWMLLALVSCLILAIAHQIENINSLDTKTHQQKIAGTGCADGGTFSPQHKIQTKKTQVGSIIHDGGSFERFTQC